MTRASAATRVWSPPGFPGLELTRHRAPNAPAEYYLLGYSFGIRLEGVRETRYRRERFTAGPGTFLAYGAGELLKNAPVSGATWGFSELSVSPDLFAALAEVPDGRAVHIERPVAADARLNARLCRAVLACHRAFLRPATPLERETRVADLLELVLGHLAEPAPWVRPAGREPAGIARARDYLHAHFTRNVVLDDLARAAGLSKHYLPRAFKQQVGVSPHTYQVLLRLQHAKGLLRRGLSVAEAALETGFADQSHLARHFKRYVGVTPGRYRQDSAA